MITPGPWKWVENADCDGAPDEYSDCGMRALIGSDGVVVCWFGNQETYYPTEGTEPEGDDLTAISLVPEMIEALEKIGGFTMSQFATHSDLIAACKAEASAILSKLEGKDL